MRCPGYHKLGFCHVGCSRGARALLAEASGGLVESAGGAATWARIVDRLTDVSPVSDGAVGPPTRVVGPLRFVSRLLPTHRFLNHSARLPASTPTTT